MPGIPDSLFIFSIIFLFIASFLLSEYLNGKKRRGDDYFKFNILRFCFVEKAVKSRALRFSARFFVFLVFLLVVSAGFLGLQGADKNLAPLFTWTIWWSGLIFSILFFGKAFCYVCPWNFLADLAQKLPFKKLYLKWPFFLRNIWLATGLFIGLTWLELGYGITISPFYTAVLGIAMLFLVLIPAFTFERKSFCRYGCLIGRVSGLYALFSPVEIRSKNKDICRTCREKNCFFGSETAKPCPTFQCLATMDSNTYCTMCAECILACKNDNVAINIRPFAKDLAFLKTTRVDEAYLAVIMLSLTSFHGLTMTGLWTGILNFMERVTGVSYLFNFTLGMYAAIVLPIGLYYIFCEITRFFAGEKNISTRTVFINFAYSFIPIALFYHLAHNISHLTHEGLKIIPMLSDPFGYGWNIFGTAGMIFAQPLSMTAVWYLQIAFILLGHMVGIFVCGKIAGRLFQKPVRAQIPMLLAMIVFSVYSLYLIAQPMVMRTMM